MSARWAGAVFAGDGELVLALKMTREGEQRGDFAFRDMLQNNGSCAT